MRRFYRFSTVQNPTSNIQHSESSILRDMPLIEKLSEHDLTKQRSRFHAAAVPVATLDEVKKELARRKRRYHKARHHCWACRVRDEKGRLVEQARDDGEVGRPGMKMLDLLRQRDLEGMLVVSRIFGGVKLGPGGVGRAFRDAASGALRSVEE
jgi:putative IMPACT (imprinted ancient) family translation regulator